MREQLLPNGQIMRGHLCAPLEIQLPTCMHTHMHAHTHMHTHVHLYTHMCTHMHTNAHTHMNICAWTKTREPVSVPKKASSPDRDLSLLLCVDERVRPTAQRVHLGIGTAPGATSCPGTPAPCWPLRHPPTLEACASGHPHSRRPPCIPCIREVLHTAGRSPS